jgi:hypothetical protein
MTCPKTRIELAVAAAMPASESGTELMMAFIFGEEKSANPLPRTSKMPIMIHNGVVLCMNENANSDASVMVIPVVVRIL